MLWLLFPLIDVVAVVFINVVADAFIDVGGVFTVLVAAALIVHYFVLLTAVC